MLIKKLFFVYFKFHDVLIFSWGPTTKPTWGAGLRKTFLPSWPDGGSDWWHSLPESHKLGPLMELHAQLKLSLSPFVSTHRPATAERNHITGESPRWSDKSHSGTTGRHSFEYTHAASSLHSAWWFQRQPGRLPEKAKTEKHRQLKQTAQDGLSTPWVHENRPRDEFHKLIWAFEEIDHSTLAVLSP